MIPLEKIMEIIHYAMDNGLDRQSISTTIHLYSDDIEISFYPTGEQKEGK